MKQKKDTVKKDITNESYLQTVFRRFRRHRLAMVSLVVLIILVGAALLAPWIAPYDPDAIVGTFSGAPCLEHWLGTDQIGRDVLSRLLYAMRISLLVGVLATLISTVIGVILGLIAGYFGGIVDSVIMRIADMMLSFPGLVLALAVAGIMGASMKNAIVAVVVVNWTKYARLGRSLVLKIRHCDYVEAAIVTGSKTPYMILRYMLPNALPTLIITAATDIGGMMLELAAMSFLGFGAKPPAPEWGYMLNEGRACIQSAPWMMIFPGLAIFVVVVVFNMLGDSLRDILDPKDE